MHLGKRLITITMALLVIGASASSSALAANPEFEPGTANTIKKTEIKAGSGEATFEINGELGSVKCSSVELPPTGLAAENEIQNAKNGVFNVLFLGCKDTLGNSCKGLNDTTAGSILVIGRLNLRYLKLVAPIEAGIAFLVSSANQIHFECGMNLIRVLGCAVGPVTPINTAGTSIYTSELKQASGKNTFVKMWNETNTAEEACELSASKNTGAFKKAGEGVTTLTEVTNAGKIKA